MPHGVLAPTTAPRLTMSVADAAQAVGIRRSSPFAAVASGVIPCIRFGRHIVVPRATVDRLLEENRRTPDNRWLATLEAPGWWGRMRPFQLT